MTGAVTATLSATPGAIALGGTSLLEWTSANATTCAGVGFDTSGAASGSATVTPTATTRYTITCTGPGGATSAPVNTTVTVGAAVTASLTAIPTNVAAGGSSTLDWSGANATSCVGTGFDTGGAPSGSVEVTPADTTIYSVTCSGAGGATSAPAAVTVTVGSAVTATLAAVPTTIAQGGSSDLTWGSANATSCTASSAEDPSWSGPRDIAGGTVAVSPSATSTYTLICSGAGGATSPAANVTVTVTGAVTATLGANPNSIALGGSSELTWGSTNATSCTASSVEDPSWSGARAVSGGSVNVSPTVNATYTLVCSGPGGASSAPANVTVSVGPAPTAQLSATPPAIAPGGSSTLDWSSTGATSCAGVGFSTAGAPAGSVEVTPSATTNYSVTCTGAGGATSPAANATVTVGSAVTATLAAGPDTIALGGSSTLTWGSANATSCIGTGFDTGSQASGSVQVSPTATTNYSVVCSGAGGATSPAANATVTVGAAVTATLAANPLAIALGGTSDLTWGSTNATSCTASSAQDPSWSGSQPVGGGTVPVTPSVTSTYTLTCNGAGGATSQPASVTVTVSGAVTASISALPTEIGLGGSSELTWSSTNATACIASSDEDASFAGAISPAGGTQSVSPTTTATYTVLCTGDGGASSTPASTTVTVAGAVTATLSADPETIAGGTSSTLSWSSTNATSCTGTGFPTGGATIGSIAVSPVATTQYSLNCAGGGGATSPIASATVVVAPVPTVSLGANPETIPIGGTSTLSWVVSNATSCTASSAEDPAWTGTVSASGGAFDVTPSATATYTISCTDDLAQNVVDNVTVVVSDLPTVSLVATPDIIAPLGTSTLTWSVTNAVGCIAFSAEDQSWTGTQSTAGGAFAVTPSSTVTTYTLTCTDSVGQNTVDTATVTLSPQVTLSANPTAVPLGGTTALAWIADHATSCTASSVPATDWTGTRTTGPSSQIVAVGPPSTEYTLTCAGPGGTSFDTTTVSVGGSGGNPPTVALSGSPPEIGLGETSTLLWDVQNASSCVGSGGAWLPNPNPGTGSFDVTPNVDTEYILTCSNADGETEATFTVLVTDPPTLSFNVDQAAIGPDESVQLSWSTTDATACTGSSNPNVPSWAGPRGPGTTVSVLVSETTDFNLSCDGPSGTVDDTLRVTVFENPTVALSVVGPTEIATGGRGELSWTVTDVTSCSADWNPSFDFNQATEFVEPLVLTEYTLTCFNSIGRSASASVTIGVNQDRAVDRTPSWVEDIEPYQGDVIVVSYDAGLFRYDISDPTAPNRIETWDPELCIDQTPFGPQSLPFRLEDIEISGDLGFLAAAYCGLWIVDLTDLASGPLATFDTDGWSEAVHIDGQYAYLADFNGGVAVFDISVPTAPQWVATVGFDDPAMGAVLDVEVVGGVAYVASEEGLRVLDVSNPAVPVEIGRIDTNLGLGEVPQDIHLVGNLAVLTTWVTGMMVVDISQPGTPMIMGTTPTDFAAYGLTLSGNQAYIAEGPEGLRHLNFSTPGNITLIEQIRLGKFVWDIEVIGGRIVVGFGDTADDSGGIQVIVDR